MVAPSIDVDGARVVVYPTTRGGVEVVVRAADGRELLSIAVARDGRTPVEICVARDYAAANGIED